jgi:hypothetical protein
MGYTLLWVSMMDRVKYIKPPHSAYTGLPDMENNLIASRIEALPLNAAACSSG